MVYAKGAAMAMTGLMRDIGTALRSPVPYVSTVILVLVLSLAEPFRAYLPPLSPAQRFEFWTVVVGLSVLWGVSLRVLLQRRFPRLRLGGALALGVVASSVVLACPIRCVALALLPDAGQRVPSIPVFAGLILIAGSGIAVLRWFSETHGHGVWRGAPSTPRPTGEPAPPAPPAPVPPAEAPAVRPRLMQRLPAGAQGTLVRLSVQGHYVLVHTTEATHSLLMRFSDALAEVEGHPGLRVHRSHWVARDAIAGHRRKKGRHFLATIDGAEVPVSRAYVADVRAVVPAPV